MITKSGGNMFSGSFRTTFTNDAWKALPPYPSDSNVDVVVPGYDMTFGGPVCKDKRWCFGAGRLQNHTTDLTMPYTGDNYTDKTDDKRVEGTVPYALNARNNFKVSYFKRSYGLTNNSFSPRCPWRQLNSGAGFAFTCVAGVEAVRNTTPRRLTASAACRWAVRRFRRSQP